MIHRSFSAWTWVVASSVIVTVVATTTGCRQNTTFRGPFDGGLHCQANERIIEGACQFVCERDPDCPSGQRCNLLTGTCEAQGPIPDAGAVLTCTTGARRCSIDAKAVEACDANGLWQTDQACPGEGYCVNDECKACQPGASACVPGNNKQVTICAADGSGKRTVTCAGATVCSQGECRECAPNSTRCRADGKAVQICQRTSNEEAQWTWANQGDGTEGECITQVCEATGPNAARCKPAECYPRTAQCKDSKTQQVCNDKGTWQNVICAAQAGMSDLAECISGSCVDECSEAVRAKSYFGCDYWTAVQDNAMDPFIKGGVRVNQGTVDSEFAFVAANRSELPTTVEVYRHYQGAVQRLKSVTLEPRNGPTKGLAIIKVPWQSIGAHNDSDYYSATGVARFAYRVRSNRPITLYQFNPLGAAKITKPCSSNFSCTESSRGECALPAGETQRRCHYYVYSNDASLLLPAHILTKSYIAMAPEPIAMTSSQSSAPSSMFGAHVAVVGTEDNTTVTVKSTAVTRAGGPVPALAKNQTQNITVNQYDVLQIGVTHLGAKYIECSSNPYNGIGRICRIDNDITGSVITSDKPIAVFGGSSCTLRPYDQAACDHVEEQLFPFETWGKNFVAQQSHPLKLSNGSYASESQASGDYWKIVAGCPASQCPQGTLISLSIAPAAGDVLPPNRCVTGSLPTNDCRLLGGSYVEFRSKRSFSITADQPIMVGQFFSGQNATGGSPSEGDPSFALLPPIEQWRSSYTLIAAPSIQSNYLALVYDDSKVSSVLVDGITVGGTTLLPGTPFRITNHRVGVGTHTIQVVPKPGLSTFPGVGVTSYGFDSYVSYGYTGGLDLTPIVTGIDIGG